ncbi:MAG: SDR family oxidoreductase [Planctomycetota bacterium]
MSETGFGATREIAVVTGASSGIGEVYARRLAGLGYDLLLTARRTELMEKLAAELREQNEIETRVVSVDLADAGQLDQLSKEIESLGSIGFLVHAAGFGYMGDFVDLPMEKHQRMLDVHMTATVRLCYATLPGMIESNVGSIVNVSSVAAWTVGPGQAMYNSSKAFVKTFSESLHMELDGTNVHVQALCPGVTYTGFHDTPEFAGFDRSEMPGSWMTPQDVVDESLAALKKNRAVCVPGSNNRFLTLLFKSDRVRRIAGKKVRKQAPK